MHFVDVIQTCSNCNFQKAVQRDDTDLPTWKLVHNVLKTLSVNREPFLVSIAGTEELLMRIKQDVVSTQLFDFMVESIWQSGTGNRFSQNVAIFLSSGFMY